MKYGSASIYSVGDEFRVLLIAMKGCFNVFEEGKTLWRDNKIFVAAIKNFAAATKRFVDRTKHFVVVTKYFCYPNLKNDFVGITKPFFREDIALASGFSYV